MSQVVLDLHGARAPKGVDIDALESFLANFRTAVREYARARDGQFQRKDGRPTSRDQAATAFRLVEFRPGSGIATLEPAAQLEEDGANVRMPAEAEALAETTLRSMLDALRQEHELPAPVVEALARARRAIGEDGCFGVEVRGDRPVAKVVLDAARIGRLQRSPGTEETANLVVNGRLHMVETDRPNRRVAVRAQDGTDWTCTYSDALRPVVAMLVERLVHVTGRGRRTSPTTGRLSIETIDAVAEHAQGELFTTETIPAEQLCAEQGISEPQGLDALVDPNWSDDEESRLFLEATLGTTG